MLGTRRTFVLGLVVCAWACGGGKTGVYKHDYAGSITLTLVNASPRPIESVFIHPIGTTDRGQSWTQPIAPGASTTLKIRHGGYELIAVSQKRSIDEHTREVPEAMSMLELRDDRGDQKLVFHDDGETVGGLDAPGTIRVTFMIAKSPAQ
jgi:hypothetical protein